MKMVHVGHAALLALVIAAACADPVSNQAASQQVLADRSTSDDHSNDLGRSGTAKIDVLDDCNPNDPGWAPTGGCSLQGGLVSLEEFNLLLGSPLSTAVVGHPAWRNEPSYLRVGIGEVVPVDNEGGRFHTFTRVARFGGGRVPPLNQGLTMAPECALAPGAVDPNGIAPGATLNAAGLQRGINRYMCCIHPWMRALIKVGPTSSHEH